MARRRRPEEQKRLPPKRRRWWESDDPQSATILAEMRERLEELGYSDDDPRPVLTISTDHPDPQIASLYRRLLNRAVEAASGKAHD